MSQEITYSFVVRDISVTMNETNIKDDLMRRYVGVEKVTRLFFDDEDDTPKTSVQVDFSSPTDAEKIRRDGNIVIGGICRRAYAIKKSAYQQPNQKRRQNSPNTTKPISEQDIVDMFEQQKRTLTEVLNSFDNKLNNAITLQQKKTTQPVLSNNA